MSSTSTDSASEIRALQERVAQLEGDVARRHDSIASLRESGDFVRRHLQGLGVGLAVFSIDWQRVPFVSVSAESILGIAREPLERDGSSWLKRIDRQDLPRFEAAVSDALSGESAEVAYRILRGDEVRWVRSRLSLVMDRVDESHLLLSFEDVTRQKLAEEALLESEARHRQIVEAATEGIVLIDAQGRISFANARMAEIFQTTPDEMIGRDAAVFLGLEDVRPAAESDRWTRGPACIDRVKVRLSDGDERWIKVTLTPLADYVGRFVSSLAMVSDITEQTRAEEIVRASQLHFCTLAMHSPTGIFQCDPSGNCLFINNRFATIAGITQEDAAGTGWRRTIHPVDREGVVKAWRAARSAHKEFSHEFRYLHDDGTLRWVWGSAVPLCDDAGRVASYLGNVLDITNRKEAEEALLASEQRFRLLSNSSPVGIWVSNRSGELVYTNPRLQAIYGYTADELAGFGFACVFHPVECESALANWKRIAAATDLHDVERRFVNAAGEWRLAHVQSAPLISSDGDVVGRVGTVEDITERRRAESQLQRSEARYRLLAEHATDIISMHTAEGTCTYTSPACKTLLGYDPEEIVGRGTRDFVHPQDLNSISALAAPVGNAQAAHIAAYRVRRKNGTYAWFETVYKAVPDAAGGPYEVIAVSRDVTVRKQDAERVRESEARLRAILNTVADGIVTVNESLIIEQFNPGAQRVFGYAANEVLGGHLRILIPALGDGLAAGETPSLRAFGLGAREVIGLRKGGTKCELEMRIGETMIAGGTVYTGILHDISKRKRTERMLRESEKLAATGRIAARIAHEINNPLAGIRNSFLLIKDAVQPEHPYFSYVRRIENETQRIARIVRRMFDLYRPDQVTRREMELDRTIRDIAALLGTIAPARDVRLDVDTSGISNPVHLPEDSVRQILYNIIINAIEASPVGGVVKVKAAMRNQAVEILVSDSGDGIPAQLRSQIYEPFFTTKAESGNGGLGLGLPISRGIVEALQGTLDFESSPGSGTVFRVCIPMNEPELEVAHA